MHRSPASQSATGAGPLRSGSSLLRARIEENIASYGLIYPWWIPVFCLIGQAGCVIAALVARHAFWPPGLLALSLVLVLLPGALMISTRIPVVPRWETIAILAAAVLLFTQPASAGAIDTTPGLLALLTAQVVARDGVREGLVVAATSAAIILTVALGPGLAGTPVHLVDILLGFVVGYMLLWQMRALAAERNAREGDRVRATLTERERIAREIHDLVAHSLSVTLLQITGARRALRDVTGAGEPETIGEVVGEIDEALADAERVGRQAMADIRQTVSTLADGPATTQALPGGGDVAGLVAEMERAGLSVEYVETGDPTRLAQATGLGLYRIAQESLANIAKHAPGSTARMEFTVASTRARLLVRNSLPDHPAAPGTGSGLAGMSARADQLGARLNAGRDGDDWVVELDVRLRERNGLLFCPRLSRAIGLANP